MSLFDDYYPAIPFDDVLLLQGTPFSFAFTIGTSGTVAQSTETRIINVVIHSLPEHGILLDKDEQILEVGSMIALPEGESRTLVYYKSNDDYFFSLPRSTSPTAAVPDPDRFKFELKAFHTDTNELVGNNFFATQEINVLNVNQRPNLYLPDKTFQQVKSSLRGGRPTAIVDGIEVWDLDKNVNRVRMNLWSANGQLTLNEKYRHLADFDSCNSRWEYDWRCIGNGIRDSNMTFLAEPDSVKYILSDLKYESLFDHRDDRITVEVWDGIGGRCIADEEQTFSAGPNGTLYSSIQSGCYGLEGWVKVPATSNMGSGSEVLDKKFLGLSVSTIISWCVYVGLILCFISSLRCCYRCCFGRSNRRGAAVTHE